MRAWMEDLIKRNTLKACQEDIDDQNGKVQSSSNVYGNPEGLGWGETEVEEEKGRFDHPVNRVINHFFDEKPFNNFELLNTAQGFHVQSTSPMYEHM
jgi:hypothetical protein